MSKMSIKILDRCSMIMVSKNISVDCVVCQFSSQLKHFKCGFFSFICTYVCFFLCFFYHFFSLRILFLENKCEFCIELLSPRSHICWLGGDRISMQNIHFSCKIKILNELWSNYFLFPLTQNSFLYFFLWMKVTGLHWQHRIADLTGCFWI